MPSRLTTSSYAVLSLLALRPWSGYELTQQATRYTITDAGRAALEAWMATEPQPPLIEVLLRLLFADLGTFDLIVRWTEFAKDELTAWPTTKGLEMTDRTKEILETMAQRRSVLDPGEEPR